MQKEEVLEHIKVFYEKSKSFSKIKNDYLNYIFNTFHKINNVLKSNTERNFIYNSLDNLEQDDKAWGNFPEFSIFKENIDFFLNHDKLDANEKQFIWILHKKEFKGEHKLTKFFELLSEEEEFLNSSLKLINEISLSCNDHRLKELLDLSRREVNKLIKAVRVEIKALERGKIELLEKVILKYRLDNVIENELNNFLIENKIPDNIPKQKGKVKGIVSIFAAIYIGVTSCMPSNKVEDHTLDKQLYDQVISNIESKKNNQAIQKENADSYRETHNKKISKGYSSMELSEILHAMDGLSISLPNVSGDEKLKVLAEWQKGYDALIVYLKNLEQKLIHARNADIVSMTKNEILNYIDHVQELLQKTKDQSLRNKLIELWQKAYDVMNIRNDSNDFVESEESVIPETNEKIKLKDKQIKSEEEVENEKEDVFKLNPKPWLMISNQGPIWVNSELERINELVKFYPSNKAVYGYYEILKRCQYFFKFSNIYSLSEGNRLNFLIYVQDNLKKELEDESFNFDNFRTQIRKKLESNPSEIRNAPYFSRYDLGFIISCLNWNLETYDYLEDDILNNEEVIKHLAREVPKLSRKLSGLNKEYYLNLLKDADNKTDLEGATYLADINPEILDADFVIKVIKLNPAEMYTKSIYKYILKNNLIDVVLSVDVRFYFAMDYYHYKLLPKFTSDFFYEFLKIGEQQFSDHFESFLFDFVNFVDYDYAAEVLDSRIIVFFIKHKYYKFLEVIHDHVDYDLFFEVINLDPKNLHYFDNQQWVYNVIKDNPAHAEFLSYDLRKDVSFISKLIDYVPEVVGYLPHLDLNMVKKLIIKIGPDFLANLKSNDPDIIYFIKKNYPQHSK